jgi:1D-myo-inositol 3-kinase
MFKMWRVMENAATFRHRKARRDAGAPKGGAAVGLMPDYVVIGHATQDLLPDGRTTPGGTVTYAGLAAQRLGRQVGVLTSAAAPPALSAPVEVCCRPAPHNTVFENIPTPGGRKQYLRASARPLSLADLPPGWERARIVHLGPLTQELDPRLIEAFPGALVGITPQGWLRRWDAQGLVAPMGWRHPWRLLGAASVVVLSPEDLGGDERELALWRAHARVLVVTLGKQGAIVYHAGRAQRVPAYTVIESDPTGAGDVFAAAFLVRLDECGDLIEAARFANCAASFAVEGLGVSSLPTREQVEWRLAHGRMRE